MRWAGGLIKRRVEDQKIAAFGSSYRIYTDPVGAAEGCDLLLLMLLAAALNEAFQLPRPRLVLITQPMLEPSPNRRPFRIQNRVPRRIAVLPLDHHVLAKHTLKTETQTLGRIFGAGVGVVAFPFQATVAEGEGFLGQQVNRLGAFR